MPELMQDDAEEDGQNQDDDLRCGRKAAKLIVLEAVPQQEQREGDVDLEVDARKPADGE